MGAICVCCTLCCVFLPIVEEIPRVLRLLLAVLLSPLLLALTASPTSPPSTPSGTDMANLMATAVTLTVSSQVTMGTAGAALPVGLMVTLHVLQTTPSSGTTETVTLSNTLTADNAAQPLHFASFTALPGDICVLTVLYQGITQGSVPHTIQPGETTLDLPITLYDRSRDPSSVRISATTQTLHFAPGNLVAVLETVDWTATGDRFFLTDSKTGSGELISVQLTLPVGARAVAFSTQPIRRFVTSGDINMPTIEDTAPVIPGVAHRIVFSYDVPYSKGAYIDRNYPYAVDALSILVPDDAAIRVDGSGGASFSTQPNTTLDAQRPYTAYSLSKPLSAGGRLIYTLNGAPQVVVASGEVPQPSAGPGIGVLVVLGAAVLLVLLVIGWLVRLRLVRPPT